MIVDERLLWKFIDRECTTDEILSVREAVQGDPVVAELYRQLMRMHNGVLSLFRERAPAGASTHLLSPAFPGAGAPTAHPAYRSMN